ncbi:MAG: DUF6323 family protein [Lachnospiraceae bacterium]
MEIVIARIIVGGLHNMDNQNWLEIMNREQCLKQIKETNQYTKKFGLELSEQDAQLLVLEKNNTLKEERRIEFGQSVLPQIIYTFCDSDFISQNNYLETLIRLQEIFFLYKNEMQDEITDEELLNFMREQFDDICYGDLDYLESTCLEIFSEAIRAGYRDYKITQGRGESSKIGIVRKWDRDLYLQTLQELFWQ